VEGFRFVRPAELRFRDLDAVGHVNNVVYLTYMESARIEWWANVTGRTRTDFKNIGMILARTEIDYRAPASYGDRLEVGVRCASLRRSSFVLEFRVAEPEGGRVFADARKVLVHYDYEARRSVPLPPELREKLKAQDPGLKEE
jgi:acyl-CoA thioester hydrolase